MRFLRENGMSVFFLVLFVVVLVGQAIAGHALYNESKPVGAPHAETAAEG